MNLPFQRESGPSRCEDVLYVKLSRVALAELARQRRRLGTMTAEQEQALEDLLLTTIQKVSEPIIEVARRCSRAQVGELWQKSFR